MEVPLLLEILYDYATGLLNDHKESDYVGVIVSFDTTLEHYIKNRPETNDEEFEWEIVEFQQILLRTYSFSKKIWSNFLNLVEDFATNELGLKSQSFFDNDALVMVFYEDRGDLPDGEV
jgi:hypothetical protein